MNCELEKNSIVSSNRNLAWVLHFSKQKAPSFTRTTCELQRHFPWSISFRCHKTAEQNHFCSNDWARQKAEKKCGKFQLNKNHLKCCGESCRRMLCGVKLRSKWVDGKIMENKPHRRREAKSFAVACQQFIILKLNMWQLMRLYAQIPFSVGDIPTRIIQHTTIQLYTFLND